MANAGHSHIIGGMFALEGCPAFSSMEAAQPPAFLKRPHLLLASGRSALALLAHALRPANVWLPSFLCGVMLETLRAEVKPVRFYAIDERLGIIEPRWLSEVRAGDMVVFIDYFGFNRWTPWGAEARQRGAWVVEDACQALLNPEHCEYAHYVILSPRKFVGVPDGGILIAQQGAELPAARVSDVPSSWWLRALSASWLRADFDKHGGERAWFQICRETESAVPVEPCKMSELSELLLRHVVNWHEVTERRRENWRVLASGLADIALFAELPEASAPLGFPVRLEERDKVRQALFEEQIYPPVHWPIGGLVPAEFVASHQLAARIMTLPCDQRYCQEDMERIAVAVRTAASL